MQDLQKLSAASAVADDLTAASALGELMKVAAQLTEGTGAEHPRLARALAASAVLRQAAIALVHFGVGAPSSSDSHHSCTIVLFRQMRRCAASLTSVFAI